MKENLKEIWYIDPDKYELHQGYVNISDWEAELKLIIIFSESNQYVDTALREFVYDNEETALNMFKGMIGIQRVKIHNQIDKLKRFDEELFEKLLAL